MSARDTLAALIERVETTAGPDRDIDFAVAAAVGWPDSPHSHQHARRYTEHLDAAVSLVPEGKFWMVGYGRMRRNEPLGGATIYYGKGLAIGTMIAEAEAATPALALCAAALRARMESER